MILGCDVHPAAACFEEIDAAVSAMTDRTVCFNAHAFPKQVPAGAVVYNLENVPGQVPDPASLWHGHEVWDFSASNAAKYDATHVPIGYHPSMERFTLSPKRDIDVVFTGCMNDRRSAVLTALADRGLNVVAIGPRDMFGKERDALLARSKLALNMLFYEDGVFPALRVAHLVANKVPVLSETCPEGWPFVSTVPYSRLVDEALAMVRDEPYAKWTARNAYQCFTEMPMGLPS